VIKSRAREFVKKAIYFTHKKMFFYHYKKITELLVPNLFKIDKIRLGREGDGTYVLPKDLINNSNVLISLGIADDISFEEDFIRIYPETVVLAFDPSIRELPSSNEKIIFKSKGVAGKNSKSKSHITLDSIIVENKIEKEIILKMDIEGWEWGVFNKVNLEKYNIPVIVIEFHFMTLNSFSEWILFPYHFYKRLTILKKIFKNYYIFHLHANNYGYTYFKYLTFPWLCEMTLIKKNLFLHEITNDINVFNSINCNDREDKQFPFLKS
jgi:hypothetical protein